MQRTADLRYVGQAFEVRVPVADGDLDAGGSRTSPQAFHAAHRQLYGYDFAADPRQAVEWVNLRVSGHRPDPPSGPGGADPRPERRDGPTPSRAPAGSSSTTGSTPPTYGRPDLAPGDVVVGPAIIEEFGSTVPVHPGFARHRRRYGNLLLTKDVR